MGAKAKVRTHVLTQAMYAMPGREPGAATRPRMTYVQVNAYRAKPRAIVQKIQPMRFRRLAVISAPTVPYPTAATAIPTRTKVSIGSKMDRFSRVSTKLDALNPTMRYHSDQAARDAVRALISKPPASASPSY
ncbi:MAG: hypothetical protein E6G47_13890 [Actinobacteria bacterium]|nr:MAG: hypothetical protein E6G47_13890 [Actinomycetota bacterium]